MAFCVVVLTCLLVAAVVTVAFRRPPHAWLLLAVSALWLPANNGHLEGPVLVTLSRTHGVTAADLLALAGFLLALSVLLGHEWTRGRRPDLRRMSRIAALACAVFGSGALLAALLSG